MSIIGILKIMEVQEDDMEVQEEAVWHEIKPSPGDDEAQNCVCLVEMAGV